MILTFIINYFWFPWINFYSESFFLQLLSLVILYFFITSVNLYYSAVSMFFFIVLFSIILAYYNLEVLSGFLLVTEFTAFFIVILFLLSLNFDTLNKNNFFYSIFVFSIFFSCFMFFLFFEYRVDSFNFLNGVNYWDDYYEAISNLIMNDIFGLYLSYYYLNSFMFLIFMFLIFIASLICILIVKTSKISLYNSMLSFNYVFNFFKDLVAFDFLRKQNMNYQNNKKPTTKLVKYKKLNVAKE